MTNVALRRIAVAALALCTALPAFARGGDADAGPIAVQMYTLRNAGSLEDQLRIVQDAGVRAVETVGTQNVPADELKRLLEQYGIQPVSAHVALTELRDDIDGVVAFHRAIGNRVLVVPWLQEAERPADAEGWRALGRELGDLARRLQAMDMQLAYHNHDFELVDFDGKTGLELLFEAAGPALAVELDLAWVARAGRDPAQFLGRFPGRVFAVHAKDNAPDGQARDEQGFAALGQGVLDWDAILPAAADVGVQWYIIEHDLPRDAAAVVAAGADFLRERVAADNQLTAQEREAGWQLLFDGRDLSQWRNFKQDGVSDQWVVEDGAIKLAGAGGGDLVTRARYGDFDLRLDWKISEGGNSGIFILADETGEHIYSHAPEIQILDNERHPDNKLDTHLSGSLYDLIASPAASHRPAGEWNRVRIVHDRGQLTIWQNGVQTASVRIHGPEWQRLVAASKFAGWPGFAANDSGHIGLQDHGDVVWFKNLKIKELNR
ncbi:sugar phosphate isomerase/epimerase [Luteimonas sp. J16]|jgi:sugar phosphate isomerase/epimerase|nr:sugar phosphate isomerase/epimerase [Luteimonas sp. J16]